MQLLCHTHWCGIWQVSATKARVQLQRAAEWATAGCDLRSATTTENSSLAFSSFLLDLTPDHVLRMSGVLSDLKQCFECPSLAELSRLSCHGGRPTTTKLEAQSRQKFLNLAGLSSVYRTVC
jgi:hypothetical protein